MGTVSTNAMKIYCQNEIFRDLLAKSFYEVYRTAMIPPEWLKAVLTPIFEPGKPLAIANLEPITVSPQPIKLLALMLATRPEIWGKLENYQASSRPARSKFDQIFIVIILCENAYCGQQNVNGFRRLQQRIRYSATQQTVFDFDEKRNQIRRSSTRAQK